MAAVHAPAPPVLVPSPPESEEPVEEGITVEEYYALCERGAFGDRRTELMDGVVEVLLAESSYHNAIVQLLLDGLREFREEGYYAYTSTVETDRRSAPEPDVWISRTPYAEVTLEAGMGKAEAVPLVVEVSVSTLAKDRGRKARKYAEAGIPEYWIVNPRRRSVDVRRDPQNGEYRSVEIVGQDGAIRPLFWPGREIAVAKILPRA